MGLVFAEIYGPMAARRVFGTVFRRRARAAPSGDRVEYKPGWYVRVRRGAKELTRYGGADRQTAVAYLARLRGDLERQELLGESPVNAKTFREFAEEYLAHCERTQTPDTFASRRSTVRGVLAPHFGETLLQDVKRPEIERFLGSKKDWTPATRNRYVSILSAIYKRAIAMDYVSENPTLGVLRGKEARVPLPLLTVEDQGKLLAAMPEYLRLLVVLAMDTGMRLGELLRLEWRDLDLEAGILQVRKSKTHRPRVVTLSSRLREVLAGSERPSTAAPDQRLLAHVIGEDGRLKSLPYRDYKAAVAKAGHPALRFHDLRHLTAINLVRGGLDLPAIQAALGHSSLQSTLRYAEYADGTASSRAAAVLDALAKKAR